MDNSEFEDNVLFPVGITLKSAISILPTATILIDLQGNIFYANFLALSLFHSPSETLFYQKKISDLLINEFNNGGLINEINETRISVEKMLLIRRFDNSVTSATLSAQYFKSDFEGIIMQFAELSGKTNAFLTEKIKLIRNDITLLKPYLNKPGKELLEKVIAKNLAENTSEYNFSHKNYYNLIPPAILERISHQFPSFTNSELNLCSLLSLKLDIEEIANLTDKTANSIRVTFHRLLKKTNLQNRKELLRILEII
jgi:DNA-binding CsgD family transcriptional regulator